jgi:hypothetical protein
MISLRNVGICTSRFCQEISRQKSTSTTTRSSPVSSNAQRIHGSDFAKLLKPSISVDKLDKFFNLPPTRTTEATLNFIALIEHGIFLVNIISHFMKYQSILTKPIVFPHE